MGGDVKGKVVGTTGRMTVRPTKAAPESKVTGRGKATPADSVPVGKLGPGGRVGPGTRFDPLPPSLCITAINGCHVIAPGSIHNELLDRLWPVRGGAAPVVVSARDGLAIQGTGFVAGSQVVALGWNGDVGLALTTTLAGTELHVSAPSVAQMQNCQLELTLPAPFDTVLQPPRCAYARNALVMPLVLTVRNPDLPGSDDSPSAPPVVLGIFLPPPKAGEAVIDGQTVKIGTKVQASRTDTANLGTPAVRWYG